MRSPGGQQENAPSLRPAWRPSREWLPALVLLAATLLVYLPVLRGGFVWDDYGFVVGNPIVEAGDGLRRFWLTREAKDFFPLTSSTFWVEWRLWGNHAAGYHVVNVLLHAASAIVLWRILRRLRAPGAWLAGLIFAVHPVAVASVAYISERKNTLSGILCLLSLLAYLKFDDRAGNSEIEELENRAGEKGPGPADCRCPDLSISRRPLYLLSLVLFLLALLAKTSVVILPFVLLLCAWWRRGRIARKDLLRSLPFFGLSVALGLMTIWFQWQNAIHGESVRPEGLASRAAAAGWIAWFYLCKVLLPAGLCAVYPRWDVPGSSAIAFLPLALLAAGMVWLWLRRKGGGRAPLFAAAYFLIALLPVLGFVAMLFMGLSLVADHLQYLAMMGVVAFAAGILARACPASSRRPAGSRGWIASPGALAAAVCVLGLSAAAWHRASLYADEERLWLDNISKNAGSPVIWHNLGMARLRTGNRDAGFRALDRAVALAPNSAEAWYERGNARARAGQYELALRDYNRVVRLNPDYALAYNNRGNVYAAGGRYEQAAADYSKVIELKPHYAEGWFNRGVANARLGRSEQARADFDRAIELKPEFAEAWYQRGSVFVRNRRPDLALRDYGRAIELKPDYAAAYNDRGKVHADAGRLDEAIENYDRAIALQPDFAQAWYNRGNAWNGLHHAAKAVRDYSKAIALRPGFADAYKNRAVAFFGAREYAKALADVKECQELGGRPNPDFLKALTEAAGQRE